MPRSQQSSTPSTPPPTSSAPLTTHSRVQFASRLSSPLSLRSSSPLCSTESRDGSGPVDQDPVWHPFADLHGYLEQTFPRVSVPLCTCFPLPHLATRYDNLNVTRVNTYGLVFHWQGSTDAKPFLSTAHQGSSFLTSCLHHHCYSHPDVVPVDPASLSQWEHLPYSGDYDGEPLRLSANRTHTSIQALGSGVAAHATTRAISSRNLSPSTPFLNTGFLPPEPSSSLSVSMRKQPDNK